MIRKKTRGEDRRLAGELPKLVGGMMAIAALGASLLQSVDPAHCLIRGGTAYVIGAFAGSIWNLLFTAAPPKEDEPEEEQPNDAKDEPAESNEAA